MNKHVKIKFYCLGFATACAVLFFWPPGIALSENAVLVVGVLFGILGLTSGHLA